MGTYLKKEQLVSSESIVFLCSNLKPDSWVVFFASFGNFFYFLQIGSSASRSSKIDRNTFSDDLKGGKPPYGCGSSICLMETTRRENDRNRSSERWEDPSLTLVRLPKRINHSWSIFYMEWPSKHSEGIPSITRGLTCLPNACVVVMASSWAQLEAVIVAHKRLIGETSSLRNSLFRANHNVLVVPYASYGHQNGSRSLINSVDQKPADTTKRDVAERGRIGLGPISTLDSM